MSDEIIKKGVERIKNAMAMIVSGVDDEVVARKVQMEKAEVGILRRSMGIYINPKHDMLKTVFKAVKETPSGQEVSFVLDSYVDELGMDLGTNKKFKIEDVREGEITLKIIE